MNQEKVESENAPADKLLEMRRKERHTGYWTDRATSRDILTFWPRDLKTFFQGKIAQL